MDLEKSLPMTLLAVVSVLAVVGMVVTYNSDITGNVATAPSPFTYGRAIATGQEKYQISAFGKAIAAMKPRQACKIFGVQGDLYSLEDVPTYISAEKFNDLSTCYPYFSIDARNTDQVCCRI